MTSFYLKSIVNREEFFALDNLYHHCFGVSSVPTGTLASWWNAFPDGLIGLFDRQKLVGGLSYWPLSAEVFTKFVGGLIHEKEIPSDQFEFKQPRHLYLSEIALLPEYRGQNLSHLLMDAYMKRTAQFLLANSSLTHIALGFSPEGSRLLLKNNYHLLRPPQDMPDGQALFVKTINNPR